MSRKYEKKETQFISASEVAALLAPPVAVKTQFNPIPVSSSSSTKRKAETDSKWEGRKRKKKPSATASAAAAAVPPPSPPLAPKDIAFTLSKERVAELSRNCVGPCIHNVVATCRLQDYHPNVTDIAWAIGGKRDLCGFSVPCKVQLKEPRATISSHHSGRLVSTGNQSPMMTVLAFYEYAKYLGRQLGVYRHPTGIEISNIHATFYVGYIINIEKLKYVYCSATRLSDRIKAVKFKLDDPELSVLVFPTGSCVLTGAQDEATLERGAEVLKPILAECWVRDCTKQEQADEKLRIREQRQADHASNKAGVRHSRVRAKLKKLSYSLQPGEKTPNVSKSDISAITEIVEIHINHLCILPKKTKNRKKNAHACTHEVAVKYEKDEMWCPLGRMDVSVIEQLCRQNGFEMVPHDPLIGFPDKEEDVDDDNAALALENPIATLVAPTTTAAAVATSAVTAH